MIFDTRFFESSETIIFEHENEEEKEFLKKLFHTRRPVTFGLNANGSISLITKSAKEARQ